MQPEYVLIQAIRYSSSDEYGEDFDAYVATIKRYDGQMRVAPDLVTEEFKELTIDPDNPMVDEKRLN